MNASSAQMNSWSLEASSVKGEKMMRDKKWPQGSDCLLPSRSRSPFVRWKSFAGFKILISRGVLDFRGAARDFSHLEKTVDKSLECNVKNLLLFNKWIRHEFCFKLGCLTGKEVSHYSFILTGSLSCAVLNLMGANISTLLWLYQSQILVVAWLPPKILFGHWS